MKNWLPTSLRICLSSSTSSLHANTFEVPGIEVVQINVLVQVVDPLLIDLVSNDYTLKATVCSLHFSRIFVVFRTIFDKQILVVDMVARQEQTDGRSERQTAVAGRSIVFISHIRSDTSGQIFRIRKRMQADVFTSYPKPIRSQFQIFQTSSIVQWQGEILFDKSGRNSVSCNFIGTDTGKAYKSAIVHYPFKLSTVSKNFTLVSLFSFGIIFHDKATKNCSAFSFALWLFW